MNEKEMEIMEEDVEVIDEQQEIETEDNGEELKMIEKKPNFIVRTGKFLWRHKIGILKAAGATALGILLYAAGKKAGSRDDESDDVKAIPYNGDDDYDEDDYEDDETSDDETYDDESDEEEETE